MRRRHNSDRTARERLFSGSHLTDEALLLSLDGELSSRETSDVDAHVQSCWSCRGRKHAIGKAIVDLVDYHNVVTAPFLPPPRDRRAIFLARLDALAAEMGPLSRLKSRLNALVRFFRPGQISQLTWIAGALLLMVSFPIFYFLHAPRVVSADELLSLTAASEARSLTTTAQPVVVQKLRISLGKKSLTRTTYRDVARNRSTSRSDMNGAGEMQVKAAYMKSSLDWNSLLDAETFIRWRSGRPESRNKVVRLADDRLRLETIPSTGPVAEADLIVRGADFHAVEENFRFQDDSEIEIAELSYEVIPFASLPTGIFEAPSRIAVAKLPAAAALRSALPSSADLAKAEVEAESVLHRLGADLGEQIDITTHAGREVSIEGVVDDAARKQQLISALKQIPFTRLRLSTINEAAQQPASSAAAHVRPSAAPPVRVLVATPPLLEAQLDARFPDKDQRIGYVNQTLSLAQLASARAWALNRLADRHPSQGMAALDDDTRQQLQVLLTDHVSALREDMSSLQNQLGEILSRSSNTPAANTSLTAPPEVSSVDASGSADDWRDRIRRIHSSTEAVHEAVATLLSSSQPSEQNDTEEIEVNLRTSLTQLQTELQALDQKIRKANLK